jgi:hypothetical protein
MRETCDRDEGTCDRDGRCETRCASTTLEAQRVPSAAHQRHTHASGSGTSPCSYQESGRHWSWCDHHSSSVTRALAGAGVDRSFLFSSRSRAQLLTTYPVGLASLRVVHEPPVQDSAEGGGAQLLQGRTAPHGVGVHTGYDVSLSLLSKPCIVSATAVTAPYLQARGLLAEQHWA